MRIYQAAKQPRESIKEQAQPPMICGPKLFFDVRQFKPLYTVPYVQAGSLEGAYYGLNVLSEKKKEAHAV